MRNGKNTQDKLNKNHTDTTVMKCYKCHKKAQIAYPNGDLCNNCFLDILYKRVKKQIRTENPFEKNEKVLVYGKLAKQFLEKAVENLPLKITETAKYTKNVIHDKYAKYDKVVIPWSADDESDIFYEEIIKEKPNFRNIVDNNKIVKIFKSILDKELVQAAKILKINFKPQKRNKEVEKIQKKFSMAKFGLVKAADEFKKAIK